MTYWTYLYSSDISDRLVTLRIIIGTQTVYLGILLHLSNYSKVEEKSVKRVFSVILKINKYTTL